MASTTGAQLVGRAHARHGQPSADSTNVSKAGVSADLVTVGIGVNSQSPSEDEKTSNQYEHMYIQTRVYAKKLNRTLEQPYYERIKSLSKSYLVLQYLFDWMTPGVVFWEKDRAERLMRTNVSFMEYDHRSTPVNTTVTKSEQLETIVQSISTPLSPSSTDAQTLKLFIVEDLSCRVIELLGSRFDIDPMFFREQIDDHLIYTTSDSRAIAPNLSAHTKRRNWFQLLNVRLRYHTQKQSVSDAKEESSKFNVLRRPVEDGNYWVQQDVSDTTVTITRTRTAIWVGVDKRNQNATVGIVLVDPTTTAGSALWHGRANWLPLPHNISEDASSLKPFSDSKNWYNAIVGMTSSYPWFESEAPSPTLDLRKVALPAIYTICAEWFVVCEYVKARLRQFEIAMGMPTSSADRAPQIDHALVCLDTWRREIPVWTIMVHETLEHALPMAAKLTIDPNLPTTTPDESFQDIVADFRRVLNTLEELQTRVDRLSDRATAEMQLAAARESLAESHNLARLTWLAAIFIPLTFVSGLFSMTENIDSLAGTFTTYFKVAFPLAILSLITARWGKSVARSVTEWIRDHGNRPQWARDYGDGARETT